VQLIEWGAHEDAAVVPLWIAGRQIMCAFSAITALLTLTSCLDDG
jgi:hypothetical protein